MEEPTVSSVKAGDTGLTLNTMQAISDSLGLPFPCCLNLSNRRMAIRSRSFWKWNPPYHSYIPDGYTLVRNVVLPNIRPSLSMNGEK